jgi:FKBP-type peptidyl-prolyl cis-trans isomerase 2
LTIASAKIGDAVKVHFTCKLEDGTVFDTSLGHEPLQFTIGSGGVVPGLEQAVTGMNEGESKTIIVPPDQAFGPHLEEKVHVVGRDQFPENIQPVIGMKFEIRQSDGVTDVVRVTDVSESGVTLDTNHPLAGKDLLFEIELVEITAAQPDLSEEYYLKAVDYQNKGLTEEAISYYQKAIELNPKLPGAYYNLGVISQQKGLIDQAIMYYEIAIGFNQEFTEAHHNLGVAFKEKGLFDEAVNCFQRVLQLRPDHAGAYYNLGNTLLAKGLYKEAMMSYRKAVELQPDHVDARWSMALIHLTFGSFEEGWKGYERRWELKDVMNKRDFPKPRWDGSDADNKSIFLYAEQGFGDTIQFVRYAPLVAAEGAGVILECQKELVPLLRNVEGVQQVVACGEPLPEFDLHCPLLSLPFLFGTNLDTIPAKIPYISVEPSLTQQWQEKISPDRAEFRIGLVWAGNPRYKFGHDRSCTLGVFSPLANFDHVAFYSLQKGEASAQAKNPPEGMKLVDLSDGIKDFSDTAAIIENLDLVISVDTAAAHLAGALGRPVWILLPFVSDWRWMLNRGDSPWYPSARLFRQPSPGDWESAIQQIQEALKEVAK